jgi:hypothetical protein
LSRCTEATSATLGGSRCESRCRTISVAPREGFADHPGRSLAKVTSQRCRDHVGSREMR